MARRRRNRRRNRAAIQLIGQPSTPNEGSNSKVPSEAPIQELVSQVEEISLEPLLEGSKKRRRESETQLIFCEEESKEPDLDEQNSQRILIQTVASNRQSLSKMSKAKQMSTCAICLEDIKLEIKATLNSCCHTYCFDCIKTWVTDCENTCPQCKKEITEIAQGLLVVQVEKQRLRTDNFQFFFCQVCRHQITEADFESHDAQTQAKLCDYCENGIT